MTETFKMRDNSWLDKTTKYDPHYVECRLEDISIIQNRQVHYRVSHLGLTIDIFGYFRLASGKLVISGQDAVKRQLVKLPYFYRWSWHLETPASFITFNDPTLYLSDKLSGGWCQGYVEGWAMDALQDVLLRFVELLGVQTRDVLLYGISAGGFWALMGSVAFPDCQVMVEIPQVDLFTYQDDGPKEQMFRRCFKDRSEEYIRERYSQRLRVIERWRDAATSARRIFYYQNIKDHRHTRMQMEPFWDEFDALRRAEPRLQALDLQFRLFNRKTQKGGHVPMERHETLAVWQHILESID